MDNVDESLPGYLVSFIALATESGVIMPFKRHQSGSVGASGGVAK